MKLLYILPLALVFSCQEAEEKTTTESPVQKEEVAPESTDSTYGEGVDMSLLMDNESFVKRMSDEDTLDNVVLKANIVETCAKKGCWMDVDLGTEENMQVRFKDYGFFVPTGGVEDKEVYIQGMSYYDTLSVAMLQHFAEDANKSQEEIDAITEPKPVVTFMATGVVIKH